MRLAFKGSDTFEELVVIDPDTTNVAFVELVSPEGQKQDVDVVTIATSAAGASGAEPSLMYRLLLFRVITDGDTDVVETVDPGQGHPSASEDA